MTYRLFSVSTYELKNNQIKEICVLKNQQWKFGIKSQIKWFKKNIKKNDIHNLFYLKSKLIGYTVLRKGTYKIKKKNSKKTYLYFDTLIIDKKYRKKKLSNILMSFNNTIIKQTGLFSFLICKKKLINFYKKNNWIKLNRKNVKILDHQFNICAMIFNNKNLSRKYDFYIYK